MYTNKTNIWKSYQEINSAKILFSRTVEARQCAHFLNFITV